MSISNPNPSPNPNQGKNKDNNSINAMGDEEITRQTIPNSVYVSFSKRRQGLFQKAGELCTKCGAEVAVLVLSPAGNPSSFGHSSVDQVLSRFLCGETSSSFGSGNNNNIVADNVIEHQKRQLEGPRKRAKLDHPVTSNGGSSIQEWVEREFVERSSSVEELEFLKQKYLVLIDKVTSRLIGN